MECGGTSECRKTSDATQNFEPIANLDFARVLLKCRNLQYRGTEPSVFLGEKLFAVPPVNLLERIPPGPHRRPIYLLYHFLKHEKVFVTIKVLIGIQIKDVKIYLFT